MRISNRTLYRNITQRLSVITEQIKNLNEQIASGKRINKSSDDPVGMTHVLRLKKVLSQIDQYGKNMDQGESWLKLTESSLQSTDLLVIRAKEIANQMATGTYSESQRQGAVDEIKNILNQLIQIGNSKLNGRYIFSGYQDNKAAYTSDLFIHPASADPGNDPAYTGAATSSGTYTGLYSKGYVIEITTAGAVGVARYRVSEDGGTTWGPDDDFLTSTTGSEVYDSIHGTDLGAEIAFSDSGTLTVGDRFTVEVSRYQGDQNEICLSIDHSTQMGVSLTGEAVFGEAGAADNLFDVLVGLRNSLENNDVHGVQSRLDQLNIIQVGLTSSLADIGSRLNRIEMSGNILNNLELSNTDRLTEIEDVDAIQAITDLNARQLVYEAALYSATQVGQLSLVDFMR